ncbi:MAG: universal stress protein [Kofleriaceae bacterium]|nr:universal stress protein [Kofleriaceae bacterium]
MGLSKIACATDFSAGANAALHCAALLASAHGGELVIYHAWELSAAAYLQGYAFTPEVIERVTTHAQRGLADAAAVARAADVKNVSTQLLSGGAARMLVEAVKGDPKIELLVLGAHGQSGARHIFGSVTTHVVRHAASSVLVVRPHQAPKPFVHILCPIDFSDSAWHAAELAAELVRPGGQGIRLVHVAEIPPYVDPDWVPTFVVDIERHASTELEQWAAKLRARAKVPVSSNVYIGSAGRDLLTLIERDPSIDLVVTGSHGRVALDRIILGSVAEKLVRYANVPVLVARQRAAS